MTKPQPTLLLLLLTMVALAARLHMIGYESLSADEARQVSYYELSPSQVVLAAAGQQQPPLDYLVGMVLNRLGLDGNDALVRLPAAFYGAGSVLLLGLLVSRIADARAGFCAAALLAVCPLHVAMSQEARPYAIFCFFLLLCLLSLLRARQRGKFGSWFLFGLCTFAMLMARWDAPNVFICSLLVGSLLLYGRSLKSGDVHARRRERNRLSACTASIGGAYAAFAPIFLLICRASHGLVAPGLYLWWKRVAGLAGDAWQACLIGFPVGVSGWSWRLYIYTAVMLGFAIGGILRLVRGAQRVDASPIVLTLCGAGLFPILYPCIYSASTGFPPKPQYMLPMTVILFATVGVAVAALGRGLAAMPRAGLAVRCGVLLALCAPMGVASYRALHTQEKTDWRGALTDMAHRAAAEDVFVSLRPFNLPGSMGAPVIGKARYFDGTRKFLEIRLDTAVTALDAAAWRSARNTVWILCSRSAATVSDLPLPQSLPPGALLHSYHDLMLIESRPGDCAAERLVAVLDCLDRGCPDCSGLIAENLFRARFLISRGERTAAQAGISAARRHCRGEDDAAIVAQFLPTSWELLSAAPSDE